MATQSPIAAPHYATWSEREARGRCFGEPNRTGSNTPVPGRFGEGEASPSCRQMRPTCGQISHG
eukprot:12578339-Alexandrium_andersonii.AAC.1